MKAILFLIIITSVYNLSIVTVDSESDGDGGRSSIEWQILTKRNFSSEIRLHSHILLMVTVPWSGESRSLMKELVHAVTNKQEKFGALKLMLVHKNSERMLADALGASEGIRFIYYHHSVSYKYQGRLRAQNILSSVDSLMSLLPEELPLSPLNTPEVLKAFLNSTDRAVILLEFCGWAPRLLANGNNTTENAFGVQEGVSGTDFHAETSGPVISSKRKDQKKQGRHNQKLSRGLENQASIIPFLGESSSLNDSASFSETENTRPGVGLSCSFEEFQHFESFFTKFIAVAREFFLPPERQSYGLVLERSLLSVLDIEDSRPWLGMIYFAGCPSCSKVFKEVDDLKSFLQMHDTLVVELEDDGHDLEPALPGNHPSILLFVDRSSDSPATREKSTEALDAFRHVALKNQILHQDSKKGNQPEKFSVEAFRASSSTSRHPRLELSPTSQKIEVKDKMPIMIVDKGKHVTLDNIASNSQGSSLPEILAYFLQQKKKEKLSSLAKKLGFQLLSDDLDIKIEDTLPSEAEVKYNQLSPKLPLESFVKISDDLDKDQSSKESKSPVERSEIFGTSHTESFLQHDKKKATDVGSDMQLMSVEPDLYPASNEITTAENEKKEEKGFTPADRGRQNLQFEGLKGSFFFSDGGYQLLGALTAGSKIPSMIIVDPISQQHFIFPEDRFFNFSSLSDFLDGFHNGSLIPYKRSDSILVSPREAVHPPFVNLDFHEVDGIPRVTASSFSNLILGLHQYGSQESGNALKEDILVLFTNSWCGFCQRMELVVHEVYRALKSYRNILKSGLRIAELEFRSGDLKDDILKLPRIYSMDCTLNECSSILKSMDQREVYPALILFPAERKNALSYEGDIAVSDVIKFIADHGSHSHHLIGEKGILWTEVEKGGRNQNFIREASPNAVHLEAPIAKDMYHEVLLKNRRPKSAVKYNLVKPSASDEDMHETTPVAVGSILVATQKLLSVHPFDKSAILIVLADRKAGFQGLIINKHISWDSLHKLEEGLEILKEAPLSFGGPVIRRGMPLVSLGRKFIKNEYPEVQLGVYFLDHYATIHEIDGLRSGNHSVADFWFFLGYSNWGWEQLHQEIAEGAWNVTDNDTIPLGWP